MVLAFLGPCKLYSFRVRVLRVALELDNLLPQILQRNLDSTLLVRLQLRSSSLFAFSMARVRSRVEVLQSEVKPGIFATDGRERKRNSAEPTRKDPLRRDKTSERCSHMRGGAGLFGLLLRLVRRPPREVYHLPHSAPGARQRCNPTARVRCRQKETRHA